MKALKKLFALILIGCLALSALSGCLKGPKDYLPSDENLFDFVQLDDGTYSVALKAGAEIPENEALKLPNAYNGKAVTQVAENGFKESAVKEVQIPASIKVIGKTAFYGCVSLSSVYFYNGVSEIQAGAFYGCSSIEELTLPSSLKVIGESAFAATSIISLQLPAGLETVGSFAFAYCESATSITLPNTLNKIGSHSFVKCNKVKEIIIPQGVTAIGEAAFSCCTSLVKVIIPATVQELGNSAFYICNKLTIYAETQTAPNGWERDWNYSNCKVVWGYQG